MIEKSTYFYSDEESLDPTCAFVGLIVQLVEKKKCGIRLFLGAKKKCLLFFRDSLWSVNTESQIAINVLYTPFLFLCR